MGLLSQLGRAAHLPGVSTVSGEIVGKGLHNHPAGMAADTAIETFANGGNLLKGGMAAYAGTTAYGVGHKLGERLAGERTDEDAERELQRQGNQSYGQNLMENGLWDTGGGIDRTATAVGKLPEDVYNAYKDSQKTQQMETKRKMSRPMSEGYKQNVNQLQGLMSRSTQ